MSLGPGRIFWIKDLGKGIWMDLLEIGLNVVDWTGVAQDRYRWRALVNSVMNRRVPQNAGNYRVAAQLVASRVVLSSTELVSYTTPKFKFIALLKTDLPQKFIGLTSIKQLHLILKSIPRPKPGSVQSTSHPYNRYVCKIYLIHRLFVLSIELFPGGVSRKCYMQLIFT
jgi:hypothetical protein